MARQFLLPFALLSVVPVFAVLFTWGFGGTESASQGSDAKPVAEAPLAASEER